MVSLFGNNKHTVWEVHFKWEAMWQFIHSDRCFEISHFILYYVYYCRITKTIPFL